MATTKKDWDRWEAEMPVPPGPLFFAALFLAVAFAAGAIIGVILGAVTL